MTCVIAAKREGHEATTKRRRRRWLNHIILLTSCASGVMVMAAKSAMSPVLRAFHRSKVDATRAMETAVQSALVVAIRYLGPFYLRLHTPGYYPSARRSCLYPPKPLDPSACRGSIVSLEEVEVWLRGRNKQLASRLQLLNHLIRCLSRSLRALIYRF